MESKYKTLRGYRRMGDEENGHKFKNRCIRKYVNFTNRVSQQCKYCYTIIEINLLKEVSGIIGFYSKQCIQPLYQPQLDTHWFYS